ncbi:MAG: hypothetical protein U9N49_01425 [Campylobacterota bacterium]|nr:hypothetical protein [Campylobacterota bacterium]
MEIRLTIDNPDLEKELLTFVKEKKQNIEEVTVEALKRFIYSVSSKKVDETSTIEVVTPNDPDYEIILKGREERAKHPENYLSEDAINWD